VKAFCEVWTTEEEDDGGSCTVLHHVCAGQVCDLIWSIWGQYVDVMEPGRPSSTGAA
jgi:hypothetical protein